jgi:predicted ArsR family transcriptional regulator
MESSEVSVHEVKVFASTSRTEWKTSRDIAQESQVSGRTARKHLLKLQKLGLLDVAEVFPGHRYRRSLLADKRNASYLQRLTHVAEIFGVPV